MWNRSVRYQVLAVLLCSTLLFGSAVAWGQSTFYNRGDLGYHFIASDMGFPPDIYSGDFASSGAVGNISEFPPTLVGDEATIGILDYDVAEDTGRLIVIGGIGLGDNTSDIFILVIETEGEIQTGVEYAGAIAFLDDAEGSVVAEDIADTLAELDDPEDFEIQNIDAEYLWGGVGSATLTSLGTTIAGTFSGIMANDNYVMSVIDGSLSILRAETPTQSSSWSQLKTNFR